MASDLFVIYKAGLTPSRRYIPNIISHHALPPPALQSGRLGEA